MDHRRRWSGARRCFPAQMANGPRAMTGVCVRVHADHSVHVPERITAAPQSVPPEYAAGPGGRVVSGRSLCLRRFHQAEHLLRPGDQQRGSHQRGRVSKHGKGTRPSTQEKRVRLCTGFLWIPPSVQPATDHFFSGQFQVLFTSSILHTCIYLFIYFSSLLE